MTVDINCDMGEAFSIYRCGDDEGLMPLVTLANVACGFHASDPSVMAGTVQLKVQASRGSSVKLPLRSPDTGPFTGLQAVSVTSRRL